MSTYDFWWNIVQAIKTVNELKAFLFSKYKKVSVLLKHFLEVMSKSLLT